MPRRSKGARLWLRPARRKGGRVVASAVWIIVDGKQHIATGCIAHETDVAEKRLAEYIAEKYQPARQSRDLEVIHIADVLSIYLDDCGPRVADRDRLERYIARLNEYWGDKRLSEVTNAECRAYTKARGRPGGARADLEVLRAAINHHAKENLHQGTIRVSLPQKGAPRDRWLTRSEAARLLWACWRYREQQTVHRGKLKGNKIETAKRPLLHLARFILIGLYTGTRAGAIASASPYGDIGHSLSILSMGSSIVCRSVGVRPTSDRHPRQYRRDCSRTCAAGFGAVSSPLISSSGKARRSSRSRLRSNEL
jgi:hypothetical protein